MDITGFDVSNFKGIREARLRFADHGVARVYTLVGLNESGKTTLLEALHSFSPDAETQIVTKGVASLEEQREQWVPRSQISNFTGQITITAYVVASLEDWKRLCTKFESKAELKLQSHDLPKQFSVSLIHVYENGDFVRSTFEVAIVLPRVKQKKARNFRPMTPSEAEGFATYVRNGLPTVAYYPTFIFDFPDRIYLTERSNATALNAFYRRLFQDILDYDGNGYTIEHSILSRVHKKETIGLWEIWFPSFVGTTDEDKVKQVIARAARAVTNVVFSKWNEVFGEEVGNKEVAIDIQYEIGEKVLRSNGVKEEPTKHDAYIRFRIKDGTSLYSVDDRSLGFRWFFSFLLFTQFRIHREKRRPTLFLFDEPASNLHAAAQMKLLESFPSIAQSPHRLIYSTHSHYMVEPKWLEQAYIVFDRSAHSDSSVIADSVRPDSTVDINVVPYRQFVANHPEQTSYFQPILDTLTVRPSKFDYRVGGLIVEGKGDYYALQLASRATSLDIGAIFPAHGSGTMGALVALHRGWGLKVRVLFDTDKGGKDGKNKLRTELDITDQEWTSLKSLEASLTTIEDLFTVPDQRRLTGATNGSEINKTVLMRRVQEALAAQEDLSLDPETITRMRTLCAAIVKFIT